MYVELYTCTYVCRTIYMYIQCMYVELYTHTVHVYVELYTCTCTYVCRTIYMYMSNSCTLYMYMYM